MRVPHSIGAALLGCLLLMGSAAAQRLPFRPLTVRDGLLSNFILSLEQDREGRLWIGTTDGITVFDGMDCRSLTKNDGLPSHYIMRMRQATDAEDGMLVITPRGMVRIRQDRLSPCVRRADGVRMVVSDVATLPDGTIVASGPDGLYRLRDTLLIPLAADRRLADVTRLHVARDGLLWLLDERGVSTWNPSTRRIRLVDSTWGDYREMFSIREGPRGGIYVCSRDGSIIEFRDGAPARRHRLPDARPVDLIRDDDGTWWIATTKGLFVSNAATFGAGGFDRVEISSETPFPEINMLFLDRERNLWYASAGSGAGWLEERSAQTFPCDDMTGVGTSDTDGRIWLSSRRGIRECWRDADGTWRLRLHAPARGWPEGYSYHLQVRDDLLYASFAGHDIVAFDVARPSATDAPLRLVRRLAPSRAVPDPDGFCFLVDRRGLLWMKTRAGDVAVVDAHAPDRLLRLLRRPHPDIRSMFEDADGSVWIAGYGGRPVHLSAPKPLHATPRPLDALGPLDVRAFLRDRDERLWLGTLHGVYVEEQGVWDSLTVRSGLASERVGALVEDRAGRIWLGTQRGPMALDPITRVVEEHLELTAHPVVGVGVLDGGLLWVAGTTGLTLLDLRRGVPDTLPPRPVLRALYVNERLVAGGAAAFAGEPLVFGVSENNFRFEFSVPHLRKARGVRLQYMFAGADTAWSEPTADRTLTLRALPPGAYALLVRARNSLGRSAASPLELRFEILPPLWRRWCFMLGAAVLLAAAVTFVVRQRVRRILETERMRARIAADLHDDIGAGLTHIAMMTDMMRQQADIARQQSDIARQQSDGARGRSDVMRPVAGDNTDDGRAAAFGALQSTLARAGATARELIDHMSDVVWSLDPRNESLSQLADRLRVFAHDLCDARDITLRFGIAEGIRSARAASDVSRTLLLILKEALNNAMRHGEPSMIEVQLDVADHGIRFLVRDDGRGFDPASATRRSGLQHMDDRVRDCGGTLQVTACPGGGTCVEGRLPLQRKN